MKRLAAWNFIIGVIVFLFAYLFPYTTPHAYATGATLSVSPATGTFNRNCNFSLQILVDTGGYETDGTDAILFYDPTRFTANKINNGTIYQDYPGNNIDAQNGKISVSGLSSVGSGYKGTGVLATVDFTVTGTASGSSQIKFDFDPNDKAKTTDSNVVERGTIAEVLNQVIDGNYVIGSGNCAIGGGQVGSGQPGGSQPSSNQPTAAEPSDSSLNQAADMQTTVAVIVAASFLMLTGIFGLARL